MELEQEPQRQGGGISASTLKLIAIAGMLLDHIGIVFGHAVPFWVKCALYAFGGLTFPIMAYLLGEGYRHTSNFRRYALRLLLFAVLTQLPYSLVLMPQGNVLFTLLLGLLALYFYDHMKSRPGFWLVFAGIVLASSFLDWGLIGVPMVLLYAHTKEKWKRLLLPYLLPLLFFVLFPLFSMQTGFLDYLPQTLFVLVGCTLSIPLLGAYNGERGRPMKYFFYVFYPVHIIILGLIRMVV